MAPIRIYLISLLTAALGFLLGVWFATRYGHVLRDVYQRSSKCSLLDLPASFAKRFQRRKVLAEVESRSKHEKDDAQGLEYWSTPHGSWWIPRGDSTNLFHVIAEQVCDIYTSALSGVRAGDIVLDCGAHIGSFTRNALSKGARLVIAIEPAQENLDCLRRNFAADMAARRVIVYPKGVWDRQDTLILTRSGSAQHAVSSEEHEDRGLIRVPVVTIDALVQELQLERVDFIKMDIEGAEERALMGAKNTLGKYRPRMAIAGYHNAEDYKTIERVVSEASRTYRMECGPCYSQGGIRPETLFFH